MFSKWVKYCLEVTITATFHKTGLSFSSVSMHPPSRNHRVFIQSLLSFEILYLRHANVTEYSVICLRNSLSQCQRAKELRNRSGICCIPRLSNGIPQKHKCPRQAACVPMWSWVRQRVSEFKRSTVTRIAYCANEGACQYSAFTVIQALYSNVQLL